MDAALEELRLRRTDLQTHNGSAPGSPGLSWTLLERTDPEPTLRGSRPEGTGADLPTSLPTHTSCMVSPDSCLWDIIGSGGELAMLKVLVL